jgi:hypothetical protein
MPPNRRTTNKRGGHFDCVETDQGFEGEERLTVFAGSPVRRSPEVETDDDDYFWQRLKRMGELHDLGFSPANGLHEKLNAEFPPRE